MVDLGGKRTEANPDCAPGGKGKAQLARLTTQMAT